MADSAIDVMAMARNHTAKPYMEQREEELLEFIPGKEPTWFYLTPLPTSIFSTWVQAARSEYERYRRSFQFGVSKIERCHLMDGRPPIPVHVPTAQQQSIAGPVAHWTDKELDELPPIFIEEIGSVAWSRSYCPKALGGVCVPPPSLVYVWTQRVSQAAAAAASRLRSQRCEELRAEAEMARVGEQDTDAPATASATPPTDPGTQAP